MRTNNCPGCGNSYSDCVCNESVDSREEPIKECKSCGERFHEDDMKKEIETGFWYCRGCGD